jgi:predicted nucleic acid-binding protein
VRRLVVDTRPLVALLNKRDQYDEWAVQTFEGLEPPLFTCEPVLAEATHLVRGLHGGRQAVLDLMIRGVVRAEFRVDAELLAIRTLMTKYAAVPMSLADACLVRMTELDPGSEVVTLDSDFRRYRRSGRLAIRLLMPP